MSEQKKHWWQIYEHVYCECGGVIGMYDAHNFTCDKCGKRMNSGIHYDTLMFNDKTGWVFPMFFKESED